MSTGRRISSHQQKALLLLYAGVALGLTRSPKVQWRVLKELPKEWQKIDRKALNNATKALYKSKLVSAKPHKDGSYTLTLTQKGKKQALRYNLDTMQIEKPKRWDGKWRLVTYDIPEKKRGLRKDVACTLKRLGFYELQHSVFVHPFECMKEIEYLIERYEAREYVRSMLVEHIDDAKPLLRHFHLSHLTKC